MIYDPDESLSIHMSEHYCEFNRFKFIFPVSIYLTMFYIFNKH